MSNLADLRDWWTIVKKIHQPLCIAIGGTTNRACTRKGASDMIKMNPTNTMVVLIVGCTLISVVIKNETIKKLCTLIITICGIMLSL